MCGRTSLADTEFKLARVETERGPVALVTIDNGEDYTKPTFFGRAALESLERLLPTLEDGDWAALVVTGKPFVFAAGADITEFPGATRDLAIEGSRAGHELFARIRSLFDEAQIVELTAAVALENFRSKFNVPLGIESQGFCLLPKAP